MGIASCALAARTGTVAGAAAAGGALGGPVGAGVGAGVGLLSVEAYQGELLDGRVQDAAFSSAPPGLGFWGFIDRNLVWLALVALLVFTPSAQYLLKKLKSLWSKGKSS